MIVPMRKVHIAARRGDHDALLKALEKVGVVHLVPVDPAAAVADEQTASAIEHAQRARQILAAHHPHGDVPDLSAAQAVEEVLRIHRQTSERQSRLAILHRQLTELEMWGDVRIEQFQHLRDAGLSITIASVAIEELGDIQAELVHQLGESHGGETLVAIVGRVGEIELPESAEVHELPSRDRPSVKAEAAELHEAIQADTKELSQLVHMTGAISEYLDDLHHQAHYTVASRGSLTSESITALQGWAPADKSDGLGDELAESGLDVAIEAHGPAEDDAPPTLVKYPRWTKPIKGLFDILGTLPGYRELDLSPFFMVALPVFAAMLIGDAGYGLLFVVAGAVFYRKLVAKAGKAKTHLIIVVGAVTMLWGIVTANYFGITPGTLPEGSSVGKAMRAVAPLYRDNEEAGRNVLIKVSFIIAVVHLTLARFRKLLGFFPDLRFLAELGWCSVLGGMFGIVWHLFFIGLETPIHWAVLVLLGAGLLLAIVFTYPSRNPAKRIGIGFAASLLPLLGTFSDTMSYIRLMAVGLATYYIAFAFNSLGADVAKAGTWVAGAPIVLFGHALNIGLAIIAVFAHGVRLNMLEFSNNAGVEWAGYPYRPFAKKQS